MRSTAYILLMLFAFQHMQAQTESTKLADTLMVQKDTIVPFVDTVHTKAFFVTGGIGITYEGYGLNVKPGGSGIFSPRAPWNQARLNLNPVFNFGDWLSIPVNINISLTPTNFTGPWAGFKQNGVKQTFLQWLTNPSNNIGISPHFKWGDILLGTQYIKYSDLSTGDIGLFGAGFAIHPKNYIVKFFTGASQQGINYLPPNIDGSYLRNHWMMQIGKEKEGKYLIAFNLSKGQDKISSITSFPTTTMPQEGFVYSILGEGYFKKGWFIKGEGANSIFTRDLNQPTYGGSFRPFITGKTSTVKDYALNFEVGKRSTNFDIAYATKYIGSGFQTTGYPYMQTDFWDNTINTRFNAWKNKMNVVASTGIRTNNISNVSVQSQQFIANLNWFTQFNDKFSVNVNYNNLSFTSASGLNPFGIKNVSNDMGITPVYTWSTKKMVNILSLNYSYSKYKERDVLTGLTTPNKTHTALLTYVPTFINSSISPDFSAMYFYNQDTAMNNTLFTLSGGVSFPLLKKKMQFKSSLQYTWGKINAYTPNNNLLASISLDYKISKKLIWNNYFSSNYFKYGDELSPPVALVGANYLESKYRTGFKYNF